MNRHETTPQQAALSWVKGALDETINQARQILDEYIESPDDDTALNRVAEQMKVAQGTLEMLEYYGAAMLAEEVGALCRYLESGGTEQNEQGLEALTGGVLQLQDYIDHLLAGHRDLPLLLLPVLNDLRAARQDALLSENLVFLPDLSLHESSQSHIEPLRTVEGPEVGEIARKLRTVYQLGFLGLHKGRDVETSLARLEKVTERIEASARYERVARFWWIIGALVESIRLQALEPSISVKLLLAKADRELKRIIDEGETDVSADQPLDLIRNCLYYLASAQGGGDKTRAVKDAYRLAEFLPQNGDQDDGAVGVTGLNASVLQTVVDTIKTDLDEVKSLIEVYMSGDPADTAKMAPTVEKLRTIADTLAMLGLGGLRQSVLNQADEIAATLEGSGELEQERLMSIASSMLRIESALDDYAQGRAHTEALESADGQGGGSEADYGEVQATVVSEALQDLRKVKEGITDYILEPSTKEKVEPLPALIEEIRGALLVSNLERVVPLTDELRRYVSLGLLKSPELPDSAQLEMLGEAVASVEYYLEAVRDNRVDADAILETAEHCLDFLSGCVDDGGEEPEIVGVEPQEADASAEQAPEPAAGEAAPAAAEAAPVVAQVEAVTVKDDLPAISGEPDDEILEIFLEEAAEEVEAVRRELPRWRANPDNADALATMRRAFHTLKGSGRLIGALRIGEFSWEHENLLNRIIDDSITPSDAIFELLDESVEALSQLVEQIKQGTEPQADIGGLMRRAKQLATPGGGGPTPGGGESPTGSVADPQGEVVSEAPVEVIEIDQAASESAAADEMNELLETATRLVLSEQPVAEEVVLDATSHGIPALDADASIDESLAGLELDAVDGEPAAATSADDIDAGIAPQAPPPDEPLLLDDEVSLAELDAELDAALAVDEIDGDAAAFDLDEPPPTPGPEDAAATIDEPAAPLLDEHASTAGEPVSDAAAGSSSEQPPTPAPVPAITDDSTDEERGGEPRDERSEESDAGPFVVSSTEAGGAGPPPETSPPPTVTPPTPIPEVNDLGFDPVLLEIFKQEVESHLETIDAAVSAADRSAGLEPSEALYRALHTIHGAARTGGFGDISELAVALERIIKLRREAEQRIEADAVDVIAEGVQALRGMVEILVDAGSIPVGSTELVERARSLEEPQADEGGSRPAIPTPTAPAPPASTPTPTAAPVAEPELDHVDPDDGGPQPVVATPTALAAATSTPAPTAAAVAEPELDHVDPDDELVGVFLDEAQELLDEIETTLQDWAAELSDQESVRTLQRQLHTVKGGARMAGLASIGDLSHALESLFIAVVDRRVQPTEELHEQLNMAFDRLHGMVMSASERGLVEPDPGLVSYLDLLRKGDDPATSDAEPAEAAIPEPVAEPAIVEAVEEAAEEPAAAVPAAEPEVTVVADDELVGIFLEEATELLDQVESTLQVWGEALTDQQPVQELQRQLHTIKGGARMAGLSPLGDLSHALESLFIATVEGRVQASAELHALLNQAFDRLHSMVSSAVDRGTITADPELVDLLERVRKGLAPEQASAELTGRPAASPTTAAADPAPDSEPPTAAHAPAPITEAAAPEAAPESPPGDAAQPFVERRTAARAAAETVRVRATLLDNLVNFAGEVSIYRSRIEQQISAFGSNLQELQQTIGRLRDQLRSMELETEAQVMSSHRQMLDQPGGEFDPLEMDRYSRMQELSRALAESVSDLGSIQGLLLDSVRDSETLLLQQSRVSTDLQDGLMRTRMVQIGNIMPRLRRIVRQTCDELGKEAVLTLEGAEHEIDSKIMDRMVAPLEHLLRNAVAHGIESPEERVAAGKPEQGSIDLHVTREGSEILVQVIDDGRGINVDAVRGKAVRQGLMEENSELTDNEIIQFILESGFSTAAQVSQIAGRGVGMDVVNNEIRQLGGALQIESVVGGGTVFTARLPFTLAINQAVLVSALEEVYALQVVGIDGIARLSTAELKALYAQEHPAYSYAGSSYELVYLGELLGLGGPILEGSDRWPLVMVRAGDQLIAMQVDSLLGSQEIVVKSVGPQLSQVGGIAGATILGDGRVVLILEVAGLVRAGKVAVHPQAEEERAAEPAPAPESTATVMVVDDSITMRKVATRMLTKNGFEVTTAKDGVDALAMLQEHRPDLILLDIEMPRMDGFELATHVRKDDRLKSVPIIMVTSRTGEKHRMHAKEIGVDRYVGKPYQEGDLMVIINELLDDRRRAAG